MEEAPCCISKDIKNILLRLFSNKILEEEEVKILLSLEVTRPLLQEYLLKHAEKYEIIDLLSILLK